MQHDQKNGINQRFSPKKLGMSDTVGARLREARVVTGLTQAEFAAMAGVGKNSQVAYEKDHTAPSTEYLHRLRPAGVDIAYILTGEASGNLLDQSEKEIIDAARRLSVEDKAVLARVAALMAKGA